MKIDSYYWIPTFTVCTILRIPPKKIEVIVYNKHRIYSANLIPSRFETQAQSQLWNDLHIIT